MTEEMDRVLDITGVDERFACLLITGIMCYPSDEQKRSVWMLRNLLAMAAEAVQGNDSIDYSREIGSWLGENIHCWGGWGALGKEVLCSKKRAHKIFTQETRARVRPGRISGFILRTMVLDERCKSLANVTEFLCSSNVQKELRKQGIEPIYRERNEENGPKRNAYILDKTWPKFKAAAHLWAALSASGFKNITPDIRLPLEQFKPGGLAGFLKLAESLRLGFEKKYPPKGRRKSLNSWKIVF